VVTVSKRIVVTVLGKDSGHSLGKDSGNSLQKEFPNGDCYLGLQNLTKSRGGGAKIHFFTEKMDFSLVRYRNSSARTHNIWGRTKKIRKNPFFYRKIKIFAGFYRNSSARTHNIWGRTKKIRKNPFFYRKIKIYATFYRNSSDGQNAPKKATVTTILIKAVTCSFLPSNSIV
jgi:hypothetical protein